MNELFKYGELVKEDFENQFSVKADELSYPVITFDTLGALGGSLYDNESSREEVMSGADKYFEKSSRNKAWVFEEYVVFEDVQLLGNEEVDVLRFEERVIENEGTLFENTVLPVGKYDFINGRFHKKESEGKVLGSISFEKDIDLVHRYLDSGDDPIADGWLNNKEEEITLDGWEKHSEGYQSEFDNNSIESLMDADYESFVKAFISIETGVEDNNVLDKVVEEFFENDHHVSLLKEDLYDKTLSLNQLNTKKTLVNSKNRDVELDM